MCSDWVPPWADPFFDRDGFLNAMADYVESCRRRGRPALMHVCGLEGLGVSSAVARFGKDKRDLFDDTFIWLRGRDADGTPVASGELLNRVLRKLGVSDADQAGSDDAKLDQYHAVARNKRFVLVLDDMDSRAQARLLLPFDSPGAVVITTSPFAQFDLEAEQGFKPFQPELLSAESAAELFRHDLGDAADAIDPAVAAELVAMCGGLPLAIKLLAAQVRWMPEAAVDLLAELRDAGLSILDIGDDKRIARFLDSTYQSLEPELATAYRLLGVLPATDFDATTVAAALDIAKTRAALVLTRLAAYHLLTKSGTGRYAFHPLLRGDASLRAETTDSPSDRAAVLERWIDQVLRDAIPRGLALSNRWVVKPVTDRAMRYYAAELPAPSRAECLAWFDTEYPNLVAAVRAAHRAGLHDHAWQLCVLVWKYQHLYGFHDTWIDTHVLGLASARAAADDAGIMQLASQLGAAYLATGQLGAAEQCFDESLTYARRLGHAIGEQSALEWLGKTAARAGDHGRAEHFYERSWGVTLAASDDAIGPADKERILALLRLQRNRARADDGRWAGMDDDIRPALDYFKRQDNETDNVAKTRLVLGRALLASADAAGAEAEFAAAAEFFEQERATRGQAGALFWRAKALDAAHRRAEALSILDLAEELYRDLGDSRAREVAAFRAGLSG
ncbi:NB-ARC domain-containing protein [Nocardia sp. NPDC059180]|uniref:NB-ARC domain-containing protein n=1 Tax=Nocardia sp. NPDC059180 TaxID=3346761 RepID=UPI00367AB6AA